MKTNNSRRRIFVLSCFCISGLLCLSQLVFKRQAFTPAIQYKDTDEQFIPQHMSLLGVAAITALGCNIDIDEYNNTTSIDTDCIGRAVEDAALKKSHQEFHLQNNIELARKRVASDIDTDTAHIDTHPSLIDIDPKFRPREEWTTTTTTTTTHSHTSNSSSTFGSTTGIAYPNIEIVAFPKAGTSQLYNILTNRPDSTAFNPKNKEFCTNALPKPKQDHPQALYDWHKQVYDNNIKRIDQATSSRELSSSLQQQKKEIVSVNGCISMEDAVLRHSYLQLTGDQQRFIVLYRDPADWMWAVWNFWTHEDDTILNAPEMWAQKSNNYRSPEKFHELFSAGTKSKHFPSRFNTFRAISVSHIRMLWRYAGKENVLLLKNEDMQPRLVNATGGFLDKLSNFTGLDRSLYRDEYVFRISNCSNNKGTQSNCGKKTSSAYDIAGNREMLPKTRELIYLFFWEECKIWAREFGIEYPDCVNVL